MIRILLGLSLLVIGLPALEADEEASREELRRLQEAIHLLQARLDDLRARRAQEVTSLRKERRQLQKELAHRESRHRDLLLRMARTGKALTTLDRPDLDPTIRFQLAKALVELQDTHSLRILVEISSDPKVGRKARWFLLELVDLECKRLGPNQVLLHWWKRVESTRTWNRIRSHPPHQSALDSPQNSR